MSIEKVVAWGEKRETDGLITYRIQAKLKGKRELNSLMKRIFEDKQSWMKFARTLPFMVEEVNQRTGKKKVINAKRKRA